MIWPAGGASFIDNPVPFATDLCRNPDNVKILGLAIAANADCIVTGDKDLLVLKRFQDVPIVTPRSLSKI